MCFEKQRAFTVYACASGGDSGAGDEGTGDDGTDDTADPDALTGSWTFEADTVTVLATEDAEGLRTYTLASTHPMRDAGPSERTDSANA